MDSTDCFEIEDLDDTGWEFIARPADPLPNGRYTKRGSANTSADSLHSTRAMCADELDERRDPDDSHSRRHSLVPILCQSSVILNAGGSSPLTHQGVGLGIHKSGVKKCDGRTSVNICTVRIDSSVLLAAASAGTPQRAASSLELRSVSAADDTDTNDTASLQDETVYTEHAEYPTHDQPYSESPTHSRHTRSVTGIQ